LGFRKPTRELSAMEILDRSFSLYSERLVQFLAPFFFAGIANGMMRQIVENIFPPITPLEELSENFFEWLISSLWVILGRTSVLWFFFWTAITIANGIAVKYASDLLERGDAHLGSAFSFTIHKLAPLLGAGLISGTLMILGFTFFIVPGIIVAIMFSLIVPVIMIEGRSAFDSLERSRRLVDRSWWWILVFLLMIWFLIGLFGVIGEALSPYLPPLQGLTSSLISAFIQPIYPIALTYLYYSRRMKEAPQAPPVSYAPPVLTEIPRRPPAIFEQPRFCIYCGQSLPFDAFYCPNCGRKTRNSSRASSSVFPVF